jgi:hypothetical protein
MAGFQAHPDVGPGMHAQPAGQRSVVLGLVIGVIIINVISITATIIALSVLLLQ